MTSTMQDVRSAKPGDFFLLTDQQTIVQLMTEKSDDAMSGLELEISRIRTVREQSSLCEWIIYDLRGHDIPLFFVAKIVDDESDTRIYFPPDDFQQGMTKGDLVNDEQLWLFDKPADLSCFIPAELELVEVITQDVDDKEITYERKLPTLHGELTEVPSSPSTNGPEFCAVTEYITVAAVDNPEIFILEIGGLDEDGDMTREGPSMNFWQGANVNPGDFKFINR